MVEYAYVEDFASVVSICRRACNTTEAGEEPFPIRVERVGGHFFPDHARTRGRDKAKEVFQSKEIEGLHVLFENPAPVWQLRPEREVLSGGASSFTSSWHQLKSHVRIHSFGSQSLLTGHNDPTLHFDASWPQPHAYSGLEDCLYLCIHPAGSHSL